jgi:hypothetical protein
MTDPLLLRVVVFREGRCWLAQGLEHDLGVQAGNLRDLVTRFELLVTIEDALHRLPPAPKYFQDLWERQAGAFLPRGSLGSATARIEWGMVA